jgi:hypothetical protein
MTSTTSAEVVVASRWRDGDQVRVRLVSAHEPQGKPITLNADGALTWLRHWLELDLPDADT